MQQALVHDRHLTVHHAAPSCHPLYAARADDALGGGWQDGRAAQHVTDSGRCEALLCRPARGDEHLAMGGVGRTLLPMLSACSIRPLSMMLHVSKPRWGWSGKPAEALWTGQRDGGGVGGGCFPLSPRAAAGNLDRLDSAFINLMSSILIINN